MLVKKKIVFVGNYWPYVFGGTRIFRVAPILARLGYEVHVFSMPLEQKFNSGDITLYQVPYTGDIFSFYRRIFKKILGVSQVGSNIGLKDAVLEKSSKKSKLFEKFLSKVFSLYQEIFGFPDTEKKWKNNLKDELNSFLEKNDCREIILVSEYPIISHVVVSELRKKFNFFWIADFVDLWSQNHNYPYSYVRKYFDERLEKKTLQNADYIMTTSEIWADKLRELHSGKLVYSMPHGFDETLYKKKDDKPKKSFSADQRDEIKIIYAGRLYPEMQDLSIFFEALSRIQSANDKKLFRVEFYSPDKNEINRLAKFYGLQNLVQVLNTIPRDDLLEKMKISDLLLVIGVNVNGKISGSIPSKIYDYIIAKKPILIAGGVAGDEIENLVNKSELGTISLSVKECENYLRSFIDDYKKNSLVQVHPNLEELMKFSQSSQVKRFLSLLPE